MTPIRLALVGSLCFAILLAFLHLGDQGKALSRVEGQLLDIRFALRGEMPPPSDVVILAIDDLALDQAQAFPLPRNVIGEAIDIAYRRGANAVVLDLLLSGPTDTDAALKAALAKNDRTAIAVSLMDSSSAPSSAFYQHIENSSFSIIKNHLPPGPSGVLSTQLEFVEHARLGHVNLRLDDDGALRRIPVALRLANGPALPSLAVTAAELQTGGGSVLASGQMLHMDARQIPLTRDNMAVLNYFGPRGTVETHSITRADQIDFSGKTVFIGATADGYRDAFKAPFDTALPGVEALATMTSNLLAATPLRRDPATWVIGSVLAIIAATLAVLATSRARLSQIVLGGTTVWLAALASLQAAFLANLWLDAATVIAALIVGTTLGFAARWETHRQRAVNLSRYQSPRMVETLASHPTPKFDGRIQDAAILFVDLADFTRRSAAIGPAETGKLLNRFHTVVNAIAQKSDGVVAYTAGDGAMIVFGLPEAANDDAKRAVSCALELLDAVKSDSVLGATHQPIPVRIGGHFGEVYGVVLGDQGRSTPTVTGDVVNTASRLQEQAKTQGAMMVLSDALYHTAGSPDLAKLRQAVPVELRGRAQSLGIWIIDP